MEGVVRSRVSSSCKGASALVTKVDTMNTNLLRRVGLLGLAVCLMLGLSGCPFGVVFFGDKALESAVRAELGKPFGLLTQADLLGVTEIQAANLGITRLDGIEFCSNLTVLNLRGNKLTSIGRLAGLGNLTFLDLGGNQVTNIEPLSGLFFLHEVRLWGASMDIVDWSALVANAQAGGLGSGDVVTLGTEWTVKTDGTLFDDFQEPYQAMLDAGVTVIFAKEDGSIVTK